MTRKYDQQTMQLMAMFEQMTGSKLRDCFRIDDLQVFVVEKGQIGRAVGRGGANVKKLASALKSKIKIIEHSEDMAQFIANTVHPIKPARVEVDSENKIATIVPPDLLSRGLLIGRQAIKLRETEKIVQRYFDLTELKVGRPEEGPQTVEEAQQMETSGTKGKTATATIGDMVKKPAEDSFYDDEEDEFAEKAPEEEEPAQEAPAKKSAPSEESVEDSDEDSEKAAEEDSEETKKPADEDSEDKATSADEEDDSEKSTDDVVKKADADETAEDPDEETDTEDESEAEASKKDRKTE